MDKEMLKQIAIQAIEERREDIYDIGDSIYNEPELGYKEFKTSRKIKDVLKKINISYEDNIAITGIKAKMKGKSSKKNVAIMGELDSIISPLHPDSDPETGAAHCCGHNCMIAGLIGVAYALSDTDILNYLAGDVTLLAVPAEEYVELGYRSQLIDDGKISFLGGKQEFIKQGIFDDVDISIMQHTFDSENEDVTIKAAAGQTMNGFVGQEIRYYGKEAHAGSAPSEGVNALQAANVALNAINAQRDTYKEENYIRVHPIISKGGDLVNVVPADVRLENYVRGATVDSIFSATEKVNKAWQAGAYALGARCDIKTLPGYLPDIPNPTLQTLMFENMKNIFGEKKAAFELPHTCGSSDNGDVSSLIPALQARLGGVSGEFHAANYRLEDKETAYLGAAKALITTLIDLLYDEAQIAQQVIDDYTPIFTKESYLQEWGNIAERFDS